MSNQHYKSTAVNIHVLQGGPNYTIILIKKNKEDVHRPAEMKKLKLKTTNKTNIKILNLIN